MSILLEALRQKSREAAQKTESNVSAEASPTLSLAGQSANHPSAESLDAVVQELHIQPPQDFDWQLSAAKTSGVAKESIQLEPVPELPQDQRTTLSAEHELELLFPVVSTDSQQKNANESVLEPSISSLSLLDENRLEGSYDLSQLPKESPAEVSNKDDDESWLSAGNQVDLMISATEPPASLMSGIEQTVKVDPLEVESYSNDLTKEQASLGSHSFSASMLTASESAASSTDAKRYLGLSKQAQKPPENVAELQSVEAHAHNSSISTQQKIKLKPKWQIRKELILALLVVLLLPVIGYLGMDYYLAMQQTLTPQLASMQVEIPQEVAESAVVLPSISEENFDQKQTSDQSQVTAQMIDESGLLAPVLNVGRSTAVKQTTTNNHAQLVEKPQRITKPMVKEMPLAPVSARSAAGLDAIVISRAASIDSLLQDAWLAWQQKDVSQAESLYHQVLERQPNQRDALIGMMAIYQYRDMPAQARDVSGRLMQLYPYDREVKSLVGQFEKNATPLDSRETQLKLQLQAAPNDASLMYQLGIHYASLQRWSEAHHMFSRASQMDELQAEYFANLAISLDHLGKREAAVAAYQRAIQLAQTRPTGVNVEALTQRLSALLD